jgi:hypothetical protein
VRIRDKLGLTERTGTVWNRAPMFRKQQAVELKQPPTGMEQKLYCIVIGHNAATVADRLLYVRLVLTNQASAQLVVPCPFLLDSRRSPAILCGSA